MLQLRSELGTAFNRVYEEKDAAKAEMDSSREKVVTAARPKCQEQEATTQRMMGRERGTCGAGGQSKVLRGKGIQLVKFKDGASPAEISDWLFNVDLVLGLHDDWTEANLVMARLRRMTTPMGPDKSQEFVGRVADTAFETGFVEGVLDIIP